MTRPANIPVPSHPLHHLPAGAASILDVGCNTGDALLHAHELGLRGRLLGIDINPQAVEAARRRLGHLPDVEIRQGSADRLPFASGSADVVVCSEVLEHVPGELRGAAIREIHRVLADRGVLILTVPFQGAFGALDPANVRLRTPRLFDAFAHFLRRPGREAGYEGQKHGVVWHHHFDLQELSGLLEPGFVLGVVRFRGCLLAPICNWLQFPFYRFGAADHRLLRAIHAVETWEMERDLGAALGYDVLIVAHKVS